MWFSVVFHNRAWEHGIFASRDFINLKKLALFVLAIILDPYSKIVWFKRPKGSSWINRTRTEWYDGGT